MGVNQGTGIYQFADSQGNPVPTPNATTDRTALINTLPKFYGGFQNSFSYKSIQLDLLFQFVRQIGTNYFFGNFPGIMVNQPATVQARWQKTGDVTNIQRYSTGFSSSYLYTRGSSIDAFYTDASYLRLKNISLSWQLPDAWRKKLHLQNCRLYLQGQNLLTITNYKGLDPEALSPGAYPSLPPLRVLTMGIQLTL